MTNVLKLKTSELVYKTGEAEKQVMKHLGDGTQGGQNDFLK